MSFQKLSVADLARRFDIGPAAARRWMARLPHFTVGRARFTTESWLASWAAAKMVNPPAIKCYDPLEREIMEQAIWRVGKLVEAGKLPTIGKVAELERRVETLAAWVEALQTKQSEVRILVEGNGGARSALESPGREAR